MIEEAEAVAQRRGKTAGACGRAHQRKALEGNVDGFGKHALVDHKVHLVVFHGRVEEFLNVRGQPVDFVDKQDVTLAEVGEDAHQVAGSLQRRARRSW